ncbi:MAG TPA: hypothetical protein VGC18_00880 [Lacisediminihabitans sp.]|uniref:hypothetical protein n=1 Tax=Lacisediminihabitans sp. TaxID=2787631 RepID=UPI002ED9970B
MERIHYAGGSVLTGTAIARALLDYARALAKRGASATVDIPARHSDGTLGRANFLIGPASQLVSETENSEFDEIVDGHLVESFERETAMLGDSRALPFDEASYTTDLDGLDELTD